MKSKIIIKYEYRDLKENMSKELLRYGDIITDDFIEDKDNNFIRIRMIKYNNDIYYHKMKNGLIEDLIGFCKCNNTI